MEFDDSYYLLDQLQEDEIEAIEEVTWIHNCFIFMPILFFVEIYIDVDPKSALSIVVSLIILCIICAW